MSQNQEMSKMSRNRKNVAKSRNVENVEKSQKCRKIEKCRKCREIPRTEFGGFSPQNRPKRKKAEMCKNAHRNPYKSIWVRKPNSHCMSYSVHALNWVFFKMTMLSQIEPQDPLLVVPLRHISQKLAS